MLLLESDISDDIVTAYPPEHIVGRTKAVMVLGERVGSAKELIAHDHTIGGVTVKQGENQAVITYVKEGKTISHVWEILPIK